MATVDKLKGQLQEQKQGGQVQKQSAASMTLKQLIAAPNVQKKFEAVMGKRTPQFLTSVLNLANNSDYLMRCEPMSIINSAMVAATMDLPVDQNLGYMYIVPYSGKAQPQMGYKGYIQLALRTGQYKAINVINVHEGELVSFNPLSEELEIDFSKKESDKVIGYAGYFRLLNGFEKSVYWTKDQIEAHRKKFSKSDFGWKKDWDAMARKTVLRGMLSRWGILSIEMQTAVSKDEIDVTEVKDEMFIDAEYSEVVDQQEEETKETLV
jgi:recombination protein RecT